MFLSVSRSLLLWHSTIIPTFHIPSSNAVFTCIIRMRVRLSQWGSLIPFLFYWLFLLIFPELDVREPSNSLSTPLVGQLRVGIILEYIERRFDCFPQTFLSSFVGLI